MTLAQCLGRVGRSQTASVDGWAAAGSSRFPTAGQVPEQGGTRKYLARPTSRHCGSAEVCLWHNSAFGNKKNKGEKNERKGKGEEQKEEKEEEKKKKGQR